MSIMSTAVGKGLKKELQFNYSHNFERKCFDIMNELIPNLIHAKSLGQIDRDGIDLYTYNNDTEQIINAYQCKGFEVAKFEKSQFTQCAKSITTFKKSNCKVKYYALIVNLVIKGEFRTNIESLLNELVTSNQVEKAELLDVNNYIKYIYAGILGKIQSSIIAANKRYKDEYRLAMEQVFYIKKVPYEISRKDIHNENVVSYIHSIINGDTNKSKWFFIISEFGFGKTSLLLNIYERFLHDDYFAIYLPLNQFNSGEIQLTSKLAEKILSIIIDRQFDRNNVFDKLFIKAFLNVLKTNKKIILMFDGIDENVNFYDLNKLRRFFNCIRDFRSACLFTMRKEFWDERQGTLTEAIGKTRKFKDEIFLKDWNKSTIIDYITTFEKNFQIEEAGIQRINKFKLLISENKYSKFYGDIPKRPLFLEMLIRDLIENDIQQRNLAEVYENFILKKFQHDRNNIFNASVTNRPLSLEGDFYKKANIIFSTLEEISFIMTNFDEFEIVQETVISESLIEPYIKKSGLSNLIEILLNSVLVSHDKRKLNYGFNVKFSHKSFQDYFLAKYLFKNLLNNNISQTNIFNKRYPYEVLNFLRAMVNNINTELDEKNVSINIKRIKELIKNEKSIVYHINKNDT